MITKFDYFYGGHVEMDNMGFQGLRVDDRIESDEHLASVFDEAQAIAQLMDQLNFDTLWLAEHHFQREGYGGIPEHTDAQPLSRTEYRAAQVRWLF